MDTSGVERGRLRRNYGPATQYPGVHLQLTKVPIVVNVASIDCLPKDLARTGLVFRLRALWRTALPQAQILPHIGCWSRTCVKLSPSFASNVEAAAGFVVRRAA